MGTHQGDRSHCVSASTYSHDVNCKSRCPLHKPIRPPKSKGKRRGELGSYLGCSELKRERVVIASVLYKYSPRPNWFARIRQNLQHNTWNPYRTGVRTVHPINGHFLINSRSQCLSETSFLRRRCARLAVWPSRERLPSLPPAGDLVSRSRLHVRRSFERCHIDVLDSIGLTSTIRNRRRLRQAQGRLRREGEEGRRPVEGGARVGQRGGDQGRPDSKRSRRDGEVAGAGQEGRRG